MLTLRPYQKKTLSDLYTWFANGNAGHPCIVLPTGSGKSIIIAEFCKDTIVNWPGQKILILTHAKELIEQDADKIIKLWPGAPVGIFSAGVGRKELDNPITVAGIQSIRNRAAEVGHVDIVLVDEAHLINHRKEGSYRKFLRELKEINPALRVIGLTATPFRLGHGLITDKPAIFDDLIEPVSIEELVRDGYLAPLRSKVTGLRLSTAGVQKRGGEYIESQLQKAVNTKNQNYRVVGEVIKLAGNRKAWLFFCTGVKHAQTMADILCEFRIPADCVTGKTPKKERERILSEFKKGNLKAITNANVLTTGFDYPDIDLIAFCRPTLSPGLYVQMAGRGMRIKSHTDHCLVLDFAGVVQTHGPVTNVQPPNKKGAGSGECPVKICPECDELVHLSARVCPSCGHEFPPPKPKSLRLHDDDIMGRPTEFFVRAWQWNVETSRAGKEMATVTYFGVDLLKKSIKEYLCLNHGGYASQKALKILAEMVMATGADVQNPHDLEEVVLKMNQASPPKKIIKKKSGKFDEVVSLEW